MTKTTLMWMLAFLLVSFTAWAQRGELRIDSGYSTASLSLASSSSGEPWNVGIAKVSGAVILDNDPDKDVLNLDIYPAREGARLLKQSGGFRDDSFANLSRYAVMSFRSGSVTRNREGKLAVTGELSVTQVQRDANIVWSNGYAGPDLGEPVAHTTTRPVTFVIEPENRTTMQNHSTEEMSALATIPLRNFPALRSTWLNSVWPIVVENEHCDMPQVRASSAMKDYSGAICTGTPIEVTPLSPPLPQRFGDDYPGPNEATTPDADEATIQVHLRLEGRG